MSAGKRDDPISRWLVQLTARVGWQKACVAMANKNARILWAVMTRVEGFDTRHVSVKPPKFGTIKPTLAVQIPKKFFVEDRRWARVQSGCQQRQAPQQNNRPCRLD